MVENYNINDNFSEENEDNKNRMEFIFKKEDNRIKNISRNHKIDLHLSKSTKNSINTSTLFINESEINDRKHTVTSTFFKNPIFKNEMLLRAFSSIETLKANYLTTNNAKNRKSLPNNNISEIISKMEKRIYLSEDKIHKNSKSKSLKPNKTFLSIRNNAKIGEYQKYKSKKKLQGKIPLKKKLLVINKTFNVDNSERCLSTLLLKKSKKSVRNNILSLCNNQDKNMVNNSNKVKLFNKYNNLYFEKNDFISKNKKNIILTSHTLNNRNYINDSERNEFPAIGNKTSKFDFFSYRLFNQEDNHISSNQIFKNVKNFLDKNIEQNRNKIKYCSTERCRKDKNRFNNLIKDQKFKAYFFNVHSKENTLNIMKDSLKKKNKRVFNNILSLNE